MRQKDMAEASRRTSAGYVVSSEIIGEPEDVIASTLKPAAMIACHGRLRTFTYS